MSSPGLDASIRRLATTLSCVGLVGLAATACGSGSSGTGDYDLVSGGTLTVCAITSAPPNIYAEDDGTIVGAEADIARGMAKGLDLDIEFRKYAFAGLIPGLQAHQCDTIISSLYIKPEREEIVSFVPYLYSGSGVAVSADNPAGVTGYDDSLCGVRAISITGATGASLLDEKSDECESEGKPAIAITRTDRASDALQQITSGQMDAFMDTAELMGYYEKKSNGEFKQVGKQVGRIRIGAATLKDNTGLHKALQGAFNKLDRSGRYDEILKKWGLQAQNIDGA